MPWNYVAIGFLALAGTIYTLAVFWLCFLERKHPHKMDFIAIVILWVSLMLALVATVLDKYGG